VQELLAREAELGRVVAAGVDAAGEPDDLLATR